MLFGSGSVEKVLLFLFVNGKCYGSLLQKLLKTPLTPIQKALFRLEKDGIIISFYEGNTKFYQFNPSYPLLPELQALLRKAFTLLPPSEQHGYYARIEGGYHTLGEDSPVKILQSFWKKLSIMRSFSISIQSNTQDETWVKKGQLFSLNKTHSLFKKRGSGKKQKCVFQIPIDGDLISKREPFL